MTRHAFPVTIIEWTGKCKGDKPIKAAYIGIDFLFPALPALAENGCVIMKIFSCETDNVTEFNTRVCGYAREHGIPLQLERIRLRDLEELKEQGCELLLCAGYYYRIPVLEGLRMVNIHPSLLPVGRGAWPMAVTILRGLRESGVTMHRLVEQMDAGDILLRRRVEVAPDENQETLMDKQRALLPEMVRELCADLEGLWENAKPQDETVAEYWPCPAEKDWTITDRTDGDTAERILRAFYGYEVIYETGGEKWELIRALMKDRAEENARCFPFGGRVICAVKARKLKEQ